MFGPAADGEIIVFHDDTTERWNGRPDPIGALPLSQLAQLDLGGERDPHAARGLRLGTNSAMPV